MIQLNERERRLLLIAAAILVPTLLLRLLVFPVLDYRSEVEREIQGAYEDIQMIRHKGNELNQLKRQGSKTSSLSLGRRINQMLKQIGLDKRVEIQSRNVKSGEAMTLRFEDLTLSEMSMVLHQLEGSRPRIVIETMDLQKSYQNKERLQLSLSIITGG